MNNLLFSVKNVIIQIGIRTKLLIQIHPKVIRIQK